MDAILANIFSFTGNQPQKSPFPHLLHPSPPSKKKACVAPLFKKLAVLCFSKDRPFQLHQYLTSLETNLKGDYEVIVLFTTSTSSYSNLYERVFEWHPSMKKACREVDFANDLVKLLQELELDKMTTHLMLCVDDMVFIRSLSVEELLRDLDANPQAFCLQPKLHPGVIYSHAASDICLPPSDLQCYSPVVSNGEDRRLTNTTTLRFSLQGGNLDWHYPFDLCGGIYRLEDVLTLLLPSSSCCCSNQEDDLSHRQSIANPNLLETTGNRLFWQSSSLLSNRYKECLCLTSPAIVVVTVNRVQDTFDVPVYSSSHSLEDLNNLLDIPDILMLDLDRYFNHIFLSVHVGNLWFQPSLSLSSRSSHLKRGMIGSEEVLVTVLIPVYNAADYLSDCLSSLLYSEQGCSYHILVVDDGSTDDSPAILLDFKMKAALQNINLMIVTTPHQGLVAALDCGLDHITTPLVARLDADDLCMPYRLRRQLDFLLMNEEVQVVGGQAVLLPHHESTNSIHCDQLKQHNVTRMPTHPLLVQFSLYFKCSLLHPSVMFRKAAVLAVGCYGGGGVQEIPWIEDYDLWTRLALRYPLGLCNLPDVVIQLRLHPSSKSQCEHSQALEAADRLRARFLLSGKLYDVDHVDDDSSSRQLLLLLVASHPRRELLLLDQEEEIINQVLEGLNTMCSVFIETYLVSHDNIEEEEVMLRCCIEQLTEQRMTAWLQCGCEKWRDQLPRLLSPHNQQLWQRTQGKTLRSLLAQTFA